MPGPETSREPNGGSRIVESEFNQTALELPMHKFLIVCASVLALTACSSTEKAATVGGVTGA